MNTYLFVGMMTTHLMSCNSGYDLNEDNRLLGVSHHSYFAATMNNSFNKRSFMFGKEFQLQHVDGFDITAYVGLTTGYNKYHDEMSCAVAKEMFFINDSVIPMGSLNVSYGNFQLNYMLNVVNIGLKFEI